MSKCLQALLPRSPDRLSAWAICNSGDPTKACCLSHSSCVGASLQPIGTWKCAVGHEHARWATVIESHSFPAAPSRSDKAMPCRPVRVRLSLIMVSKMRFGCLA